MKKSFIPFAAAIAIAVSLSPKVFAAAPPDILVNGVSLGSSAMSTLAKNTTYVSLRALSSALLPTAEIDWSGGFATVSTPTLSLTAAPKDSYITVNGQRHAVPLGVKVQNGRVLLPVRTLASALGAEVLWSAKDNRVIITGTAPDGPSGTYDSDALYWLSRIISAESAGESLEGKIAVGNVVLNRVRDRNFPDTVYGVIFDDRWGGQFEPVRTGTVYLSPSEESVKAAKQCLEGTNVAGDCLYFIAPTLAQNFWTVENREYVMSIGRHDFYR